MQFFEPSSSSTPAALHRAVLEVSARAGHAVYLGHDDLGWRVAGRQHSVLVIGPPRSGKTSAVLIPNVLAANGPVVSTSTKPDVLAATADARRAVGRTFLFDPTGTVTAPRGIEPLRWSPLQACGTWPGAQQSARTLVAVGAPAAGSLEATHWTERAQALLAPLLHAAALDGEPLRTVLSWVDRRRALPAQQILAFDGGSATDLARDLLDGIAATDERELSGIWSTASGALGSFRTEEALAATTAPNFDAARFVTSADTVYLAAPAHRQAMVAPLVVGLVDDVRRAAYEHHAHRGVSGVEGPGPHGSPVLLALDEVANVAPLPELPAMVSEGGGQGLITLACFQDLSQARHRWPGQADGFPSLFGTTLVLPGIGDVRTLEALATLAGDEEVPTRTVTSGRSLTDRPLTDLVTGGRPHVGRSISTQWRRRLPADQISRGVTGHAVSFDERNRPGRVPLAPAHRTSPWRELCGPGIELGLGAGRGHGGRTPGRDRIQEGPELAR